MARRRQKTEEKEKCCKRGFPTFAIILLVIGLLWLMGDLDILTINLPWIPIILIIVAVGMIINRYHLRG